MKKHTILYSHGNAEDVGLSLQYLDQMALTCGVDIFAYEYSGYSIATGEASEANCYLCIDAAYSYLVDTLKMPSDQIVAFGRSIGSGPTVDLASRLPLGGMVLQSPLSSGGRVVLGQISSYVLYPLDIFRNYEKIGKVECRTLIIHGIADEVVPFWNGEALHKSLTDPHEPLWIPGKGHNNMPDDLCLNALDEFMSWLDASEKEKAGGGGNSSAPAPEI